MNNTPPYEFHHEIRQSSVILMTHIVFIELIMVFLHILMGEFFIISWLHSASAFGLSAMTWETIIFHTMNIVVIFMIIRNWANTAYTLTPWVVSITSGIFSKTRTSFDINHIESASVKQGILWRLFDYGTVQIKSPFFDHDIFLKRIPSPQHLVYTIENQRLYNDTTDQKKSEVTYFKKT